jgi:hypothetical protein
LKKDGKENA